MSSLNKYFLAGFTPENLEKMLKEMYFMVPHAKKSDTYEERTKHVVAFCELLGKMKQKYNLTDLQLAVLAYDAGEHLLMQRFIDDRLYPEDIERMERTKNRT